MAHWLLPTLAREFTRRHPSVKVDVHDHADPVLRQPAVQDVVDATQLGGNA